MTLAYQFHEMASPFLSSINFELVADPNRNLSVYQASSAEYRSINGLNLSITFQPMDGSSVSIYIGRWWLQPDMGPWGCLSNTYSVLTQRFGIQMPLYYKLVLNPDEIANTMVTVLKDLQRSLPEVLERTTLEDLICIESEQYGAKITAELKFGPNCMEVVEISSFDNLSQTNAGNEGH